MNVGCFVKREETRVEREAGEVDLVDFLREDSWMGAEQKASGRY
jgi:hypothetical protein